MVDLQLKILKKVKYIFEEVNYLILTLNRKVVPAITKFLRSLLQLKYFFLLINLYT